MAFIKRAVPCADSDPVEHPEGSEASRPSPANELGSISEGGIDLRESIRKSNPQHILKAYCGDW